MVDLESQLFQGHAKKYQVQRTFEECNGCGTVYEERPFLGCKECESGSMFNSKDLKVDAGDCSICGQEVVYTRDNRVNTEYHIFGYLCYDCENALEVRFDGSFFEPSDFLQSSMGEGFKATPVDSDEKETVAWMFSLQTKVEDVGFWSYQPDESRVWLASVDNTYCGYVSLNSENTLNQIWVDKGYRRKGIATKLVKYLCENVLTQQDKFATSQTTDKGRKFFQSIVDDEEVFGKDLL
ncbi:GNAT family N-acetyltransferase [Haladaptatus pallidirubidus]|uniref:N-acetyltransferase domain-containing protein n=1 Tax=Haladaptatus pallidirubidus TaxID=1008152 RepID=A0AAV3UGL6_9EURY|nr:GNAT family N-acetyltransferase [Haladaptatus pallidirubidus]